MPKKKKARQGRPKKKATDRHESPLLVRFTAKELQIVGREARKHNISMAELVRCAVFDQILGID